MNRGVDRAGNPPRNITMAKNSDEPIEVTTPYGSSDSGQRASSASWPHDDEVDDGYD